MKAQHTQSDFKQASAGARPAIMFQLIDLGTMEVEYQGKIKHQRKVRLGFELHGEDDKTEDGKPMIIGRTFTLSSYETAQLRQFIEGWRSKSFTEDEAIAFEYRTMLGKPCILNVSHDTGKNGKTYANVDTAMRLMAGMTPPVQVNKDVYFYMGDDEVGYLIDEPIYTALPDWMKKVIDASPEYRRAIGLPEPTTAEHAKAATADAPFDDEIPF